VGARPALLQQLYERLHMQTEQLGIDWARRPPDIQNLLHTLRGGMQREMLTRQARSGIDVFELRASGDCTSRENRAVLTLASGVELHFRPPAAESDKEWLAAMSSMIGLFCRDPLVLPAVYRDAVVFEDSHIPESFPRRPDTLEAYSHVLALRGAAEAAWSRSPPAPPPHAPCTMYALGSFNVTFSQAFWADCYAGFNLTFRVSRRGIESITLARTPERDAGDVRVFRGGSPDLAALFAIYIDDSFRSTPWDSIEKSEAYQYLCETSGELSRLQQVLHEAGRLGRGLGGALLRMLRR